MSKLKWAIMEENCTWNGCYTQCIDIVVQCGYNFHIIGCYKKLWSILCQMLPCVGAVKGRYGCLQYCAICFSSQIAHIDECVVAMTQTLLFESSVDCLVLVLDLSDIDSLQYQDGECLILHLQLPFTTMSSHVISRTSDPCLRDHGSARSKLISHQSPSKHHLSSPLAHTFTVL